ncbi:hypothetical protein PsYK624_081460 [Phanerochaete sordida]|uniref:Condensation domain-containing protein n=1 Tax=Phanerochaete sordida TaxID=48140 RepID=A0A9P3LEX6_9APHY|nr:hypothetical protein PsYK624_081460 [Phanerochaete sordida]
MPPFDAASVAWRTTRAHDGAPELRRALGPLERGFYWDACFDGVALLINRLALEAAPGAGRVLDGRNVRAAWLRLKQRFPLLGAVVEERDGGDCVEFVLREDKLRSMRPGEFTVLEEFAGEEDALRYADALLTGHTVLSNELLARVYVARQRGAPRVLHVFIPVVHFITDGVGNATIERELCQELAKLSEDPVADVPPLHVRVQALLPVEAYSPALKLSMPRRRWRAAIAKVIDDLRLERIRGGHTLPLLPPPPPGTPPRSRTLGFPLSPALSLKVAQGCHALGLTLGSALPVLSALAFARVLHRLHARGALSSADLARRRREPMYFSGPISFRPFLDRAWLRAGGWNEVCIAISYYGFTLPFMPGGAGDDDGSGAPAFAQLLSPERFVLRARRAAAQARDQLAHPLLDEFHLLLMPKRSRQRRAMALAWRARQAGRPPPADAPQGDTFEDWAPWVVANGGASLGNRDLLIPASYPLAPKGAPPPEPVLRLRVAEHDMRSCAGERYLGAMTARGVLTFFCCVDENCHDAGLAGEWTAEVRDAALHYLVHANPRLKDGEPPAARL